MLIPRHEFKEVLRGELQRHLTLSHPIFAQLLDGRRSNLPLLQQVALQGYQLTKNFPIYIEHLHFYCQHPSFKRALLVNLYEEETGKLSGSDNHLALMQRFIRGLGIDDRRRDEALPLPATAELIEYRMAAVKDPARYHVGAAAVMVASEGQNLETSTSGEPRHHMLARVYGLSEYELAFFSVHQAEDVGHVEQGLNLVSYICQTETMQQEALQAVDHTCRLFYQMYDAMYEQWCACPASEAVV